MSAPARVALVTGGARRVGAAIVRALAERGFAVAIHAARSGREAEALAAEIAAAGGRAVVLLEDLRDPDAAARLVERAVAALGRLDVLVNSAANLLHAPIEAVTPALWDEAFALNVRAPFFLAQAAARRMGEGSAIVNITDHLAVETAPSMAAHGASKAALVQLTRTLARALAPAIRVNAVSPGLVVAPPAWTAEDEARFLRHVPLGRSGAPQDVADAVCWLVDASYVTGVVIPVDGGRGVAR